MTFLCDKDGKLILYNLYVQIVMRLLDRVIHPTVRERGY